MRAKQHAQQKTADWLSLVLTHLFRLVAGAMSTPSCRLAAHHLSGWFYVALRHSWGWLCWVEVFLFLQRWRARRAVRRRKSAAVAVHTAAFGVVVRGSSVSSFNSTSCWWLFWDDGFLFQLRWCARRAFRRWKSAAVAVHTAAFGWLCFHSCVFESQLNELLVAFLGRRVSLPAPVVRASGIPEDGRALLSHCGTVLGGSSLLAPVACASGSLETEGCDEVRERGRRFRDGPGVPNNPGQSV